MREQKPRAWALEQTSATVSHIHIQDSDLRTYMLEPSSIPAGCPVPPSYGKVLLWICSLDQGPGQVRPNLQGKGKWQRASSRTHVLGHKGNPELVPLSRETAVIPNFWTLCPMAWYPGGGGGAQLVLRKEADMRFSGRGTQERQPKPEGWLAATDKQVSLVPKVDKCCTSKSSYLTATESLLEHQELPGNGEQ